MSAKKTNDPNSKGNIDKKTIDPVAVVGIGASAGGLEACRELIKSLPVESGMSFVFILHLEPTHESKLSEIFSKFTSMPVLQVREKTKVKRNHIYTIPPNKYLSINNGYLLLSERQKSEGVYLPIDYFFDSLATEQRNKAIAIVLSGTANDGTEGLRKIKSEGGLTFAQDEKSAKFTGMPASAVDSGNVDIILPPGQIGRELLRIGSHPYIAFPSDKEVEIEKQEDGDIYTVIFRKLRSLTGVDFSNYKSNTIKRRITRRMVLNKSDNIQEYAKLIRESDTEVRELYRDLLINVTNFFRDPEVFDMLREKVFPEITANYSFENPLRIWVPGCSTGEEVYSIVISLLEYLEKKGDTGSIQVFATDINDTAIEKARSGIYLESEIKTLPENIKRKYFSRFNNSYQINKSVRDVCVFARQDISKDPPFSRLDLISCRNLLIYFSSELQKKIIPVFHYALKPGRFLLLGTSESVGGFGDLFHLDDRKYKLYTKKESVVRSGINFSFADLEKTKGGFPEPKADKMDIQKEADRIILNKYSPPGILVNSSMDIVQFRGKISQYLDPNVGDASLNVFKMLKEIFNLDLRTAIRKTRQNNEPVIINNIRFESNGTHRMIDLEVIPIKSPPGSMNNEYSYLIVFRDRESESAVKEKPGVKKKSKEQQDAQPDSEIDRLKNELIITKEHLQSIIEERDATNEELRSALEELQSSNEELQSTNEEMETAREELQSTNEELGTVNDELGDRNEQLSIVNNDLNNLISSLQIPIIMLDKNLRIRRYTPKAEKLWNLISGDIGRPIENINPNVDIPELKKHILEVLDDLESKEFQIKDKEGNWYSVKIRPYRTENDQIDGVVISLYDIDTLKKEHDSAVDGKDFAREVFSNVDGAILILDDKFRLIDATKKFYKLFNLNSEDYVGEKIFDIGKDVWNQSDINKLFREIIPHKRTLVNFSYILHKNDESMMKILINTSKIRFPGKKNDYIVMVIKDTE